MKLLLSSALSSHKRHDFRALDAHIIKRFELLKEAPLWPMWHHLSISKKPRLDATVGDHNMADRVGQPADNALFNGGHPLMRVIASIQANEEMIYRPMLLNIADYLVNPIKHRRVTIAGNKPVIVLDDFRHSP